MKDRNTFHVFLILVALGAILNSPAMAQSERLDPLPGARAEVKKKAGPIAAVTFDRTEIKWSPLAQYDLLVLTVSRPDGEVIRQEFESGVAPFFKLVDENGAALPDGQYNYELRLAPVLAPGVKDALRNARENDNDAAVAREMKKNGSLPDEIIQTGAFLIAKGALFMGEAEAKGGTQRRASLERKFRAPLEPPGEAFGGALGLAANFRAFKAAYRPFDQVIPDDLIVQGSACVGLDCVNNEAFGFDTIRLKENNLRILFDDTSVGAGFPNRDWQLTANDSAVGGANKFSIEDITGALVPFTITAGAPTNSLFVSSTGRVGLRTSTPVLDLHIATGNTPAHRLEQNASGGFTAQTWDIAGNEANFFVRDVTGGSRLPFRIRPGAPTSSIDIAASGNVGIGTASPGRKVEIAGTSLVGVKITDTSIGNAAFLLYLRSGDGTLAGRQFSIFDENAGVDRLIIDSSGRIGIGVINPTQNIQHSSGATLTGAVWTNGSSRALKTDIRSLSARDARATLRGLNPVMFRYKANPSESFVGFIAEDVPELVATNDRKGLSPMDIVAVLTKVVQEQQKTIAELQEKVAQLEKARVKKARLQKQR